MEIFKSYMKYGEYKKQIEEAKSKDVNEFEYLISCKICWDRYNLEENKPLALTCGHTFCAKCIEKQF